MRQTVGKDMGVKAAAGIRTLKDALAMIEAGANRIGTSTAVAIVEEIPHAVVMNESNMSMSHFRVGPELSKAADDGGF